MNTEDVWLQTMHSGAAKNIPTAMERVRESPITPAIIAALLTIIILIWLRPQFVQYKQYSKIALPSLNYAVVFLIGFLVFISVIIIPGFL
jgi:putative effector of murein hydrolase